MYDKMSLVRRLSQIGTILMTRFCGVCVGQDDFGNRYFRSRSKKACGHERRWVLYSAEPEATLVPPVWYGWLHGTCDEPLPNRTENSYVWQRPHQPNLSVTAVAPLPMGHPAHDRVEGYDPRTQVAHESWMPPA